LIGKEVFLEGVAPLNAPRTGTVVFARSLSKDAESLLNSTPGALVIAAMSLKGQLTASHVLVENPRLEFARVADRFFFKRPAPGIDTRAVVDPHACVSASATIGPGCTIGPGVHIGDNTVLHAGVYVYDNVRIGRGVLIDSGTVIGASGFGHERNADGQLVAIPHFGGVVIGDDVEIGANTTIDRGTLSDTIIGDRSKIDNQVQISHNCRIGSDCIVVSQVVVCGSVDIGHRCWLSTKACVLQKKKIGDDAFVGAGAVVTRDVPSRGIVAGSPAIDICAYKRLVNYLDSRAKGS